MDMKNKCKKVIYNHMLRQLSAKEAEEMKIKSKGVGIWICEKCGEIVHSM